MNELTQAARDLFSIATTIGPESEINRAVILDRARDCRIRELNMLIRDLNKHGQGLRRQAYDILSVVGCLTDEVRRRAEELEVHNG